MVKEPEGFVTGPGAGAPVDPDVAWSSPKSRSGELSTLERQYLFKALEFFRAALVRQRTKEVDGSPGYRYRSSDIQAIDQLKERFV